MLKIDMEFNKGILFIRLDGNLNKYTSNKLIEDTVPVILKHGLKRIVVNLDKVNSIDIQGINSLMDINDVVTNLNGRAIICSITNNDVKSKLKNKEYITKFYEASNELTALGVMKLWPKL